MLEKTVFRVEKKYELSLVETAHLRALLDSCLIQDVNNEIDGYNVRSLYFDTIYNDDLLDKESGLEFRQKIRLRIYNSNPDKVCLERKSKQGQFQYKQSLMVTRQQAEDMMNSKYGFLNVIDNPFANELYYIMTLRLYRPKVLIEYKRLAYVVEENSTRITLDTNIGATVGTLDIFDNDAAYTRLNIPTVLEVKYNNFLLDYVKDIVNMANKLEISVSKYALACRNSYL